MFVKIKNQIVNVRHIIKVELLPNGIYFELSSGYILLEVEQDKLQKVWSFYCDILPKYK